MLDHIIAALNRHPSATGICGAITSLSASVVTSLEHIELVLRIASGAIGCSVGILTGVIAYRNRHRHHKPGRYESEERP